MAGTVGRVSVSGALERLLIPALGGRSAAATHIEEESYEQLLGEAELHALPFRIFGAVCRRTPCGEEFNFRPQRPLFPGVAMRTLFADSAETLNLSFAILELTLRGRTLGNSRETASTLARRLCEPFAAEMLAPLAGSDWHLPLETLSNWAHAQQPRRG